MTRRNPIYIGNDNVFRTRGIKNSVSGQFINDATVELTLYDKKPADGGVALSGQSWPLTLAYVAASDGEYQGTIEDTVDADAGDAGIALIAIAGDGLTAELLLPVVFGERGEPSLAWTSRNELEQMFGLENVKTWADLNNGGVAAEISDRIQWAVEAGTADAREMLVDSPVKLDVLTEAPSTLRTNTTRLAGVLLYESRGVKDTENEEGKHRLKFHADRANLYFRQIQAGVRRIGDSAPMVPGVVDADAGRLTDAEAQEVALWAQFVEQ